MGIETGTLLAIASGAGAAATGYQALEARKAKKQANLNAALERERLAALEAEKAPVMPTADDETQRRARQRSIAAQLRRRGRSSTILTNQSAGDSLGA